MKELNIKVDYTFEVTNEIQTYGRDGSKHRIGSFEGNGIVFLEILGKKFFLFSFEKQKRRNQYSGRLDTYFSYFGRNEVEEKLNKLFNNLIIEEKLKIGKNYPLFINNLANKLQNNSANLQFNKVFSYKTISYSIVLP